MRATLLLLLLALAACSPPEAQRKPGEPGADVGNRGASLVLHGRNDAFHGTPSLGQGR